jgi:hypothetical protein
MEIGKIEHQIGNSAFRHVRVKLKEVKKRL